MAGLIRNSVVTTQFAKRTNTGAGNIPFAAEALRKAIRHVTQKKEKHVREKLMKKALAKYSDK